MEQSDQIELAGSEMEVTRLARSLWKQVGSPPGGYREFWLKVARSKAAALDAGEAERAAHAATSLGVEQSPSPPGWGEACASSSH